MPRIVVAGAVLCAAAAAGAQDRTMPPEAERQLARDDLQRDRRDQIRLHHRRHHSCRRGGREAPQGGRLPGSRHLRRRRDPTKSNLVVRYHGTGRASPILLLAHTDVVEAKREDWSMDPFVSPKKTATSTAAASATTKRRRRSGSPT